MNYLIMNSDGLYYSMAGMEYTWVESDRQAAVFGDRDEAETMSRVLVQNRSASELSPTAMLFVEETELSPTP